MLRDYAKFDATDIVTLVKDGSVTPREVLDSALNAISHANTALNAVVETYPELAERQIRAGLPNGPLCGLPILLKDLGTPCEGTRSTFGSELFADAPRWSHDCVLVDRLKKAGAVIIGRTNSCEFGISLTTEPTFHGPTQNPHRLGHTAGGSSGGAAAAVASGMVPLAHATDGCGSIRVPASFSGAFGLKVTRARISLWPDAGEGWAGMSGSGGITKTVRDTALLLDVISGGHTGDPYFAPAPVRSFRSEVGATPDRLRIGVCSSAPNGIPVDPECIAAVERAVDLCDALGHEVVEFTPDFDLDQAIPHLIPIWAAQLWSVVEPRYRSLGKLPDGSGMEPVSWQLAMRAQTLSADTYATAVRFFHRISRELAATSETLDILVTPVTARPAWPLGELRSCDVTLEDYLQALFTRCPFTVQFNITGQPAMTVPLHRTKEGIPVGVQFAASVGQEGLLLRLAAQLEAIAPWRNSFDMTASNWQEAGLA